MSPDTPPPRNYARSPERLRADKRLDREARFAKWSGIASFVTALLATLIGLYPLVAGRLGFNVPEFRFGTYWGVDGDTWLSFWGAIVGAFIAAGATIAVLYAQINHQARIAERDREEQARLAEEDRNEQAKAATEDRAHQTELARLEREVSAALELRDALVKLTEYVKTYYPYGNPSPTLDERFDAYETAVYRWSVNSGLPSAQARAVIAQMLDAGKTLVAYQDGWTFLRIDQVSSLETAIGEIIMSVTDSIKDKWQLLEKHVNYYHETLVPLREKYLADYEGKKPERNSRGNLVDSVISVTATRK